MNNFGHYSNQLNPSKVAELSSVRAFQDLMASARPSKNRAEVLASSLLSDDVAAAMLFRQLCRHSIALRRWLWDEFARSPMVRADFKALIENDTPEAEAAGFGSGFLLKAPRSWEKERCRIKAERPDLARPYGGLNRPQMEALVRIYQSGGLDLRAFILSHDWRQAGRTAITSPALILQSARFIEAAVNGQESHLLRHLAKATKLNGDPPACARRSVVLGYLDRWKIYALFYMLRHPQASYRTRDLLAHLSTLGLRVSAKDIQRFCTRHGIHRDTRAGRPRGRPIGSSPQ